MHGLAPRFIINISKRWNAGQTLKIAFKGGDTALHEKIASTINEWTQYANLTFDFGINPSTGEYRTWKPTDTSFAAEIRVSFDQTGYFSLVANDSINPAVAKPGEESLNLQGFDQSRQPTGRESPCTNSVTPSASSTSTSGPARRAIFALTTIPVTWRPPIRSVSSSRTRRARSQGSIPSWAARPTTGRRRW